MVIVNISQCHRYNLKPSFEMAEVYNNLEIIKNNWCFKLSISRNRELWYDIRGNLCQIKLFNRKGYIIQNSNITKITFFSTELLLFRHFKIPPKEFKRRVDPNTKKRVFLSRRYSSCQIAWFFAAFLTGKHSYAWKTCSSQYNSPYDPERISEFY